MNQVLTVMQAKSRMARHQIASVRHESKLKIGVPSVAAVGLWFGALFLFYHGFAWLIDFGGRGGTEFAFGVALLRQSLSIFSLSIFLLLVFSNTLVAFFHPLSVEGSGLPPPGADQFHRILRPLYRMRRFSLWSLAYLGSPMMIAYAVSTGAGPMFYLMTALMFLPYVVIPACLGCYHHRARPLFSSPQSFTPSRHSAAEALPCSSISGESSAALDSRKKAPSSPFCLPWRRPSRVC